MGINIYKIPMMESEIRAWREGCGFIDFESELYITTNEAHDRYNSDLKNHYNEEPDDHDYTFDQWCNENNIMSKWDINHWYGGDNWDWEIVEVDLYLYYLIIAVKE